MADTVDVQVTGKSKEEIAHQMAMHLLINIGGKKLSEISRKDYLNAHVDAVLALSGSRPR